MKLEEQFEMKINIKDKGLCEKLVIILFAIVVIIVFSVNLASSVMMTCLETKNNLICQEIDSSVCNSECTSCIPSSIDKVSECKQGTCYDTNQGICEIGAVKFNCESKGSRWFDDPYGNIQECRKGCCIINDRTDFMTDKQCARQSAILGIPKNFKPEIRDEISCYGLSRAQEEGACVFESEFENTCKYTTKAGCLGLNGKFYSGYLCSNPDLKTNCEKQKTTGCVQGKDEIYWFDSCGNRENIYDANKIVSYNNGKVLNKNQSCSLGNSGNPFSNQGTCGNCNYLLGSICGLKTSTEKLADSGQNVVCKDLKCTDRNGKIRENGESWCKYSGRIGLDIGEGGFLRNTDVVGSRHFKEVCIDGKIKIEPCEDYREGICIESKEKSVDGRKISFAACKENRGDECIKNNDEVTGKGKKRKTSEEEMIKKCSENPYCFVKQTSMLFKDAKTKKGNAIFCVPKFAKGFKLDENGYESAKEICGLASKTYKFIPIKKAGEYLGQMNDFCMSLGDCGAEANIVGEVTSNYVAVGPKNYKTLSSNYLKGIKAYAKPINAMFITTNGSFSIYLNETDLAGIAGLYKMFGNKLPATLKEIIHSYRFGNPALFLTEGNPLAESISLGMPWLDVKKEYDAEDYVAGAFSFGIASVFLGETISYTKVVFTCKPWEAPFGGANCDKCGKDELPCSEYACKSLGKYCKVVNENTKYAQCVSVAPDDVSPPTIKPIREVLLDGYSYENEQNGGVTIKTNDNEGCIKEYQPVMLGIELNEPGMCKYESFHAGSIDEMSLDFGDGSYYTRNKTQILFVPDLESLGIPGYGPDRKTDLNIYIRCRDNSGNANERNYVINMCVKPGEDTSRPIVLGKSPESEYVSYNQTERYVQIFLSEPSECKWAVADKKYDEMTNNLECDNTVLDITNNGWQCEYDFPINTTENKFYVRCKDQPWLIESNETSNAKIVIVEEDENGQNITKLIDVNGTRKRNVMENSYSLTLKRTSSKLNIDSITPNNETIKVGVEPATVKIEVVTSGGVDGKAKCEYKIGENWVVFSSTFETTHTNIFNQYNSGDKTLLIRCKDLAGNVAEKTSRFNIKIDTEAPKVTRVYESNGLVVVTDESSECSYSYDSCSFAFENGTLMTGSELIHSTNFNKRANYYIKCKDVFGNVPGACNIIVTGGIV